MILIRKGCTYRHVACIDVDMHVLAIKYLGPDYFKLKVCWVYQRNPWMIIDQPGTVKLMRKDLCNWRGVE